MEILYITLLTIVAAGVGTLTGFGTSTVMVPTLVLVFPLPQTLLLVGIIHWFGSVWKVTLFREGIRWPLILLFGIPGVLFTYLGAHSLFVVSEWVLARALGVFLVIYVVFLFLKPRFRFEPTQRAAIAGGALSGYLAGVFGMGGAVRGVFLSLFDLPKAVYIGTAGAIGLAVDSIRVGTYVTEGARLSSQLSWGLLFFIPASFLGARAAKSVVDRIPQDRFRAVVAVFLLLVGLRLVVFPV